MTTHRVPTDFLSAFEGTGVASATPAPAVAPQVPQPALSQPIVQPQPQPFNANDPQVQAGMALVRNQMQSQHQADITAANQRAVDAEARAVTTAQQLKEIQDKAKEAERAQLPDIQRLEVQLKETQDTLTATVRESNNRIQAWQIRNEVEKIRAAVGGQLEVHLLDTSSVEALAASAPKAVQAYAERKKALFTEFATQLNLDETTRKQAMVEGLLPGPGIEGFPTAAQAQPPVQQPQGQIPQFTHPQLDGGASYGALRELIHGRVVQADPTAGAQAALAAQQASPVVQPQGAQTVPGAPQPQNVQQLAAVLQALMGGGAQPQAPQPQGPAPIPDTANAVNGMGLRGLNEQEQTDAALHAQAAVMRHRGGPQAVASMAGMDAGGMNLGGHARGLPSQHPAAGQPLPQPGGVHPMIRNH